MAKVTPTRAKKVPGGLTPFFPIADAVAQLFKPRVEVVVHDLKTKRIAYIANPISKRQVGELSAQEDRFDPALLEKDVIGPYRKVHRDGRNFRAITAVLKDDQGRAVAMMCINLDVSVFERLGEQIAALAFLPASLEPHAPFFHDNWRQALERFIENFEAEIGTAAAMFDAEARQALVSRLDRAGLLSIRNSTTVVAGRLGISRAGLYAHIKKARKK